MVANARRRAREFSYGQFEPELIFEPLCEDDKKPCPMRSFNVVAWNMQRIGILTHMNV